MKEFATASTIFHAHTINTCYDIAVYFVFTFCRISTSAILLLSYIKEGLIAHALCVYKFTAKARWMIVAFAGGVMVLLAKSRPVCRVSSI